MSLFNFTELEAVNTILRNMGEVSVNSLIDPPLAASEALNTLIEVAYDVQKRGWYFNTETRTFNPDHNGQIPLPPNTLHVETIGASRGIQVTVRAGKLYRIQPNNNGFKFGSPVILKVVFCLDFSELPPSAKAYITLRAARVVQLRTVGDAMSADEDSRDEQRALAEMHSEQLSASKLSLANSLSVASSLSSAYSPLILR